MDMNVEKIRQLIVEGHLMNADDIDGQVSAWQNNQGSSDDGDGFVAHLVKPRIDHRFSR